MKHRKTTILTSILAGASLMLAGCGSNDKTTYVTTIVQNASEGLDLQAVTDLATKAKSAEDFEQKLNAKDNDYNNMDLDADGKVDYIKVTEIAKDKQKGFSLTTELSAEEGEEQEIATIQFEQEEGSDDVTVQTHGNSQIYGHNHYYHHRTSMTDVLIMGYLLSSHRPYASPWGYNHYPSYYSSYRTRPSSDYSRKLRSKPGYSRIKRSSSPVVKTPIKSPNFNKTATKIKAPLNNPTSSQRSFQKRNPATTRVVSKGFGGSSSSSRFGSSSSSRSRSSFGGGK
ncbi:hypothetical protein SAMN02745181_1209 [Rubritalea squalenifaciens DSM 18772]|uniref:EF-hand domain-containing protein n=1 Tax=Rubritalea squalenifaciens DSM 18772 TaxID=1123071 RepID=A0A1M6GMJ3_9BACT|nr:hypothetical protein [Rubritalea squalenifaciens]SHJ11159.1 hypothetical protein SAMN02745181_1209 [Rubritalea squalenifaciens DSM 18772]